MTAAAGSVRADVLTVTYWAAARAAAGTPVESVPLPVPATVAAVVASIVTRHGSDQRLADVLQVCTILVNEQPAARASWHDVRVGAGDDLQVLPPFAGG